MNRLYQLVLLTAILLTNNAWAQKVQADFDYAVFYNTKTGPYIETYISFNGDSLNYSITDDSTLVALTEVTMLFKNADKIKEFRKFKVASAELPDTTTVFENVINKQRINMPNGIYNFDIIIKDLNGSDSMIPYRKSDLITVDFPENEISLGGIELLDKYAISRNKNIYMKGEYECIPYVSNNYNKNTSYLKVYTELYNAAKAIGPLESFFFLFHIEEVNTNKPIKGFSYFEKQKAYNLNSVYKELRIKNLPAGHYFLAVEIQDSLNRRLLMSKKYFAKEGVECEPKKENTRAIEVANTFVDLLNPQELPMFIEAVYAISDANEKFFIDSLSSNVDLHSQKQFFLNFWQMRGHEMAEELWLEYKVKLDSVENNFSSENVRGYTTDKGKTILAYGLPNEINKQKQEDGSELEIWHYYKLWDQSKIYFKFSNNNKACLVETNLKWQKSTIAASAEEKKENVIEPPVNE